MSLSRARQFLSFILKEVYEHCAWITGCIQENVHGSFLSFAGLRRDPRTALGRLQTTKPNVAARRLDPNY